jgi:hypothetical protein
VTEEHKPIETDIADSNPNAAGPHGLEGHMGISSERPGPRREDPDAGVEGTGSHGSSVGSTDGSMDVDPSGVRDDPADVSGDEPNPDGVANKHRVKRTNPGHSHG